MKLYLVHCGFYDSDILDGVYESHVNFFVSAANFEASRLKAKENPLYQSKRMHIDGMQQLDAIDGFRIQLLEDAALAGRTHIVTDRYRGLAPRSGDKPALH